MEGVNLLGFVVPKSNMVGGGGGGATLGGVELTWSGDGVEMELGVELELGNMTHIVI